LYGSIEELQKDLDEWMDYYNNHRTHQGKMCCGRTPIETLEDGKSIWVEKNQSDRHQVEKWVTVRSGLN
ncbi:hypothetical protein DDO01_18390, partial [Vibrio cholerae]|nr:hypothetical protein [Vibrio cholerae]